MDDQQAREAAAKALHDAQWEHSRYHPEWDSLGHGRSGNDHIVEAQAHANAAIDAYLAALPVASRSDIPEQSRQANEEQIVEALANRLGEHPAAFNVFDITDEATNGIKLNEPVEELAAWLAPSVAALVSSPSEQSDAPKETVTPAREAILRETIIREVLDWLEGYQPIAHAWDEAREHFGVSS